MAGKCIHKFDVNHDNYFIVSREESCIFTLVKNSKNLTDLHGMCSTCTGEKKMRFESFRPISNFEIIEDRIAVEDAIAYLEKRFEA